MESSRVKPQVRMVRSVFGVLEGIVEVQGKDIKVENVLVTPATSKADRERLLISTAL